MEWYTLIRPLGIITYSLVALNVVFGLLGRWIKFKYKLKLHTITGIVALVSATFHFVLILVFS